jgi:translation elongation factor EF-4
LKSGDVGYIISGIKVANEVKVGDTITHTDTPCEKPIDGFEDVKPISGHRFHRQNILSQWRRILLYLLSE